MTNTNELKEKIVKEGFTIESLANKLNIHKNVLTNKINNNSEFSQKNIIDLKNALNLTDKETIDIFLT